MIIREHDSNLWEPMIAAFDPQCIWLKGESFWLKGESFCTWLKEGGFSLIEKKLPSVKINIRLDLWYFWK